MGEVVVGVDVGGTNTDAVLMEGDKVISWFKHFTTDDVTSGVIQALTGAVSNALKLGYDGRIIQINIGTTHYINAIIQRKNLSRVAVIRLCGPASRSLPPFSDFDRELEKVIDPMSFMVNGGYQYDGSVICTVDFDEILTCLKVIAKANITHVVVSGVFSVIRCEQEVEVKEYIKLNYPHFEVTISSDIGTMGLLERENAAILNESLKDLCHETCSRFQKAFEELNLMIPLFYTQNDGTVLSIDKVMHLPVATFCSGPTNSMRGAAFLSGIKDGIVCDIGGTSTDVGLIQRGFPREASTEIKVGGVSTNFRMPDVISGALGGGTIVEDQPEDFQVGPTSVGYNISSMARVFGGSTTTTTDIAVSSGIADVGNRLLVKDLRKEFIDQTMAEIQNKIESLVDEVKISAEDLPMIVVGGGSIIFDHHKQIRGVNRVIKPGHFNVANAVGAALTQIGGFFDEIMTKRGPIDELIERARTTAIENAVANGAAKDTVAVVSQSVVPLPYLPSSVFRIKVKAIGDKSNASSEHLNFVKLSSMNFKAKSGIETIRSVHIDEKFEINKSKLLMEPTLPQVDTETGEWKLSEWDVECIALGAGILGCGGGGSPRLGRLMLLKAIKEGRRPRIIHPERLIKNGKADDRALFVAFYGSPTVLCEKLTSGEESKLAVLGLQDIYNKRFFQNGTLINKDDLDIKQHEGVTYVEDYKILGEKTIGQLNALQGKKISCVCSAEIGGMNAIEPLVFGAKNDLPVADVDGIGRAVPELQMICPLILGESLHPAIMVDVKGNMNIVLGGESNKQMEDHFRRTVVQYGCDGLFASAGLPVSKLLTKCVGGSISRCWRIGNAVLESRHNNESPFEKLVEQEKVEVICCGKIVNVLRKTEGGFSRGKIEISEFSASEESIVHIEFQNENLIAFIKHPDGHKEVKAIVPELISVVDYDTCVPITTDMVEYGQKVAVLLLPPPAILATEECLDAIGPKAFGYQEKCNIKGKKFAEETYISLP